LKIFGFGIGIGLGRKFDGFLDFGVSQTFDYIFAKISVKMFLKS
jgi:hypothetical protein